MWALKSFLYASLPFLSSWVSFALRPRCLCSHEDISSRSLFLSQFCWCPLGVRLLSWAQSPPASSTSQRREASMRSQEPARLVWGARCTLAHGSCPERADWVVWCSLGHRMGTFCWPWSRLY